MFIFFNDKLLPLLEFAPIKIYKKIIDLLKCDFVRIYQDDINLSEYIFKNIIFHILSYVNSFGTFLNCPKVILVQCTHNQRHFCTFCPLTKSCYFLSYERFMNNPRVFIKAFKIHLLYNKSSQNPHTSALTFRMKCLCPVSRCSDTLN